MANVQKLTQGTASFTGAYLDQVVSADVAVVASASKGAVKAFLNTLPTTASFDACNTIIRTWASAKKSQSKIPLETRKAYAQGFRALSGAYFHVGFRIEADDVPMAHAFTAAKNALTGAGIDWRGNRLLDKAQKTEKRTIQREAAQRVLALDKFGDTTETSLAQAQKLTDTEKAVNIAAKVVSMFGMDCALMVCDIILKSASKTEEGAEPAKERKQA